MEDIEKINKDNKKRSKNTYPIYMDKDLINKVRYWQEQVNERFSGLVTATVSDVCVALLEVCDEQLEERIYEKIEASKLDPIKKLKLLLSKAVKSSKSGENFDLQDLLDQNSELLGLDFKKRRVSKTQKKADKKSPKIPIKNSVLEVLNE